MKHGMPHFQKRNDQAFTRVDLLAIMVVVLLPAGWLGFNHLGERGRIAQCTRNLQILGRGMQSFANDHGSALPPAGVEQLTTTWDTELLYYLQPISANASSPGAKKQAGSSEPSIAGRFFCPSDPIKRDRPRSYAMSEYDMKHDCWPPGPNSTTGVGLAWNKDNLSLLLGAEVARKIEEHNSHERPLDALALVKFDWIPDAANTLLLTESLYPGNRLGDTYRTTTWCVNEQLDGIKDSGSHFHNGRFNYLMADGHVELLTPFQAGSRDGSMGIWTIKKGD
jgi:prepilin-type processing-associated H-X9-DG protein